MRHSLVFSVQVFVVVASISAGACSCAPLSTEKQIEQAKHSEGVIFRGELIAHKGGSAVFRVDEQWKGNVGAIVRLQWRDGSRGDCNGFWPELLKVGNKMLVFGSPTRFGRYRTSICLPTKLTTDANEELRELGPGKPPARN
jgi:hypothetical protein